MQVKDYVTFFNRKIPFALAASWDRVGLLIGDPEATVTATYVCLDLELGSIQEAKEHGANLIITHHPCLFPKAPLNSLLHGNVVYHAIQDGFHVIALHTNFDQGDLEASKRIASGLSARIEGRLFDRESARCSKIHVFTPEAHHRSVQEAAFSAGAGKIGWYEKCSFTYTGVGTFQGLESRSNPHFGSAGEFQKADELASEFLVPEGLTSQVLQAIREVHPYEEPAIDCVLLESKPKRGFHPGYGYGFWSQLEEPQPFSSFVETVCRVFHVPSVRLHRPLERLVSKVGFTPGAGKSFLPHAESLGLDVFITGEVGYHEARQAVQNGVCVLELGHAESEVFFKPIVEEWIQEFKISGGNEIV